MQNQLTRKITTLGLFAAITVILVHLVNIPLLPNAPFLKFTPADAVILIATFMFGVPEGIIITLIVSLIQGIGIDGSSGIIGIIMNFLGTASYISVAGLIYHKNKTKKQALIALVLGSIAMIITMLICNLIFTPLYMNISRIDILKLIPTIFLPFNAIKGVINSLLTWILYKKTGMLIGKFYKK